MSHLFDMAMRGEIIGAGYFVKLGPYEFDYGLVGCFTENPDAAIRPVNQLKKVIEKMGDAMEVHTSSKFEL